MSTPEPVRFRNVRIGAGAPVDLLVRGGEVAAHAPGGSAPSPGERVVDAAGALALPGLVDGHTHLDKTLIGLPWLPHPAGPERLSRIETERRLRRSLPAPIEARAAELVRRAVALGTVAIRTHVDVDPDIGLAGLHAVLAVRERFRERVDIEIVAFPQSGVVRAPGTADLLDAALREGADLVGGIDPIGLDGDLAGQLDAVFAVAARHGAGADLHIHGTGPDGVREIEAICERARALGLGGRVTVSHGFALGALPERELAATAARMAQAGVGLVTHGAGHEPLPPIKALRAHGVEVFAGNDNVRDTWAPYGNGDMLERAMLIAWRAGFRADADLELALELASRAGARALGLPPHGVQPGERADFFCVRADAPAEAVVSRPPREWVVKAGRVVFPRDAFGDPTP